MYPENVSKASTSGSMLGMDMNEAEARPYCQVPLPGGLETPLKSCRVSLRRGVCRRYRAGRETKGRSYVPGFGFLRESLRGQ